MRPGCQVVSAHHSRGVTHEHFRLDLAGDYRHRRGYPIFGLDIDQGQQQVVDVVSFETIDWRGRQAQIKNASDAAKRPGAMTFGKRDRKDLMDGKSRHHPANLPSRRQAPRW